MEHSDDLYRFFANNVELVECRNHKGSGVEAMSKSMWKSPIFIFNILQFEFPYTLLSFCVPIISNLFVCSLINYDS